jgi:hypothetical protein
MLCHLKGFHSLVLVEQLAGDELNGDEVDADE